eukprot:COSAG02_NODE_54864_length_293_cov_1.865979_1_plen_73_part_10
MTLDNKFAIAARDRRPPAAAARARDGRTNLVLYYAEYTIHLAYKDTICVQSVSEFLWDGLRASIEFPLMPKHA